MKILKFIRQLICPHDRKECITNLHGDMVNLISTKNHIYRSVWRCKKCGKCFFSEKLDPECTIVNWYKPRGIEYNNIK